MGNDIEKKIPISAASLKQVMYVLNNQLTIFGADEDTQSAFDSLVEEIDGAEYGEEVLEGLKALQESQEEAEDALVSLSMYSRVNMTLSMLVSQGDLDKYGGMPEVTALGPLKSVRTSVTKVRQNSAEGPDKLYQLVYHVVGTIDFDVLERLLGQGFRIPGKTVFGLEITSPYWDEAGNVWRSMNIELE